MPEEACRPPFGSVRLKYRALVHCLPLAIGGAWIVCMLFDNLSVGNPLAGRRLLEDELLELERPNWIDSRRAQRRHQAGDGGNE